MGNFGQILGIIGFMVLAGIIGYFISLLLSKIHIILIFFVPVFFLFLGGLLFLTASLDLLNAGWGNIAIYIYSILALFIAIPNILTSLLIYYRKIRKH